MRALSDAGLVALQRQFVGQHFFRRGLHDRVDRGRHDDVVLDAPDEVMQHVHDPVGDIIDRAVLELLERMRGLRDRELGFRFRDESQRRHRGQHHLRAPLGAVRIARRREPRRRFDEAGEHRGFREVELLCGFAEIALRGGFDAIGAGAEIDAVEIEIEDLVLGEFALQPQRQNELLDFARVSPVLREEQVFRQLLRDRRAALRNAAAHDVGAQRASDAHRIDAMMVVEAPVLDRDEGLRHVFRQFLERRRDARSRRGSRARGRRAPRSGSTAGVWALPATGSPADARRSRPRARCSRSRPTGKGRIPNRRRARTESGRGGHCLFSQNAALRLRVAGASVPGRPAGACAGAARSRADRRTSRLPRGRSEPPRFRAFDRVKKPIVCAVPRAAKAARSRAGKASRRLLRGR